MQHQHQVRQHSNSIIQLHYFWLKKKKSQIHVFSNSHWKLLCGKAEQSHCCLAEDNEAHIWIVQHKNCSCRRLHSSHYRCSTEVCIRTHQVLCLDRNLSLLIWLHFLRFINSYVKIIFSAFWWSTSFLFLILLSLETTHFHGHQLMKMGEFLNTASIHQAPYLHGRLAAPRGNASWRTRQRGTTGPWSSASATTCSGRRGAKKNNRRT